MLRLHNQRIGQSQCFAACWSDAHDSDVWTQAVSTSVSISGFKIRVMVDVDRNFLLSVSHGKPPYQMEAIRSD